MKKVIVLLVALVGMIGAMGQGCLPEGIEFTTQEQIDNFQTNYPGCTEIEGDVVIGDPISGYNINNLDGLTILTSIWGSLTIIANNFTSLSGLENLDYIGSSLTIGSYYPSYGCYCGNHNLVNLTGLNGLDSIGGDLVITCNQSLANLTGLESLTKIGGTLNVGKQANAILGGNPSLVNLTGLTSLTDVQNIIIRRNLALTNLTGLEGLTSIEGSLYIWGNPITSLSGVNNLSFVGGTLLLRNTLLENLSELENLEFIGGLYVAENEQLQSLAGLENIEFIGGSLGIADNDQLVDLSGLENIDSIGGGLGIGTIWGVGDPPPPGGNDLLTDLSALINLKYVGAGIDIGQNNSLSSLAGLENINAATITDLLIGYNFSLSTCEVQSVCDYLSSPNGAVIIEFNASGCNSPEEVQVACLTDIDEQRNQSLLTIIPNPSNDKITISSSAFTGNTQLSIFTVSGEKVIERQLTDTEIQIDISALPRGVYFVRVQNEKMVEVGKMVKE